MFTLKEISELLSIPFEGDGSILISGPAEPKVAQNTQLALAMGETFLKDLTFSKARAAILIDGTNWRDFGLEGVLLVQKTHYALAQINSLFQDSSSEWRGIHETAILSKDVMLSKNVSIGPYSFISSEVKIAENSVIGSHVFIGKRACIGEGAIIHSGVRIGPGTIIGDRLVCHSNVVVGSDGFSFVSPDGGGVEQVRKGVNSAEVGRINHYVKIASLGSVIIGENVEIGAGSVIDRGTIANTIIGKGTKLDNLVHVAHNVVIGENCLLCGQVGIAGSAKIGNRVVLGGQVGVADHVTIGCDSIIAGKSGVSSNVPKGRFMMGNPAMKMENNVESYKLFRRLPRILKKIESLQQIITKSEKS